jgi:probable HAF family extracellular repeat protein
MKTWPLFLTFACAVADAQAASQFIRSGDLSGGQFTSFASAVSNDGQVVVGLGSRFLSDTSDAFYWTQSTGIVNLQTLPITEAPVTSASGVSRDRRLSEQAGSTSISIPL